MKDNDGTAFGGTLDSLVGRAVDLLKSLDEIDCGDYSRECGRCGGAGTVGCVQDGMRGQGWCPICGGTGITWDADQQRREKLEIIAASLTPNATHDGRSIRRTVDGIVGGGTR